MLDPEILGELVGALDRAEAVLLEDIADGSAGDEDDMTGRLAGALRAETRDVPRLRIRVSSTESSGRTSAEAVTGADTCGVIRILTDEGEIIKGFLAQAKRSGKEGCHFAPPTHARYSHWLYRDQLHLQPSGTVEIGRPGKRLQRQCGDMLSRSAASFVFVYAPEQVAVVGALPVLLCGRKAPRQPRTALGTKRLSDFFVHIIDCLIGDTAITAWDDESLRRLPERTGSHTAFLLDVDARVNQ